MKTNVERSLRLTVEDDSSVSFINKMDCFLQFPGLIEPCGNVGFVSTREEEGDLNNCVSGLCCVVRLCDKECNFVFSGYFD